MGEDQGIFVRIWLAIKAFFKKVFGKKEKKAEAKQEEAAPAAETAENKEQA